MINNAVSCCTNDSHEKENSHPLNIINPEKKNY